MYEWKMLRTLLVNGFLFFILTKAVNNNAATATSIITSEKVTTQCEFYNETMCRESKENGGRELGCNEAEECEAPGDGKRSHCYVLWRKNEQGIVNISLKGCFLNNEDCYNKTECVERTHKPKKDYMFCCCEGNMCNQRFVWDPAPTEPPPIKAVEPATSEDHISSIIIVAVALILFGVVMAAVALYLKGKKHFHQVPTMEPHSLPSKTSTPVALMPIQLEEIKARGRFGAVWKARHKQDTVAVKIFPIQDKQSWLSEQEIYKLPYMEHPNILHFIGVEARGSNLQTEFWLISEYHDRGSLCDYLKAHTLTWTELCHIAKSITRGLTHLHDVYGKSLSELSKPAIAHRDFKSKNVLLKNDLTACIADFGLALIFHSGKSCGDTHGQVGTRRYMAPEVLEGAISFTSDAFLRIDMYACGLVLWELASRCLAPGVEQPSAEYRLPFEEEVGPHPTLEDMQEAVVQRKVRPTIPAAWRKHTGLTGICDTMEECWDHDPEARLSASCVMERILMFSRYPQGTTLSLHIENESPVKENSI